MKNIPLSILAWNSFKIGCTSFGGFMALISALQHCAVEQKKWLSQEEFLDGVSLATILPGPVAVNMVAYVGYRLRQGRGAFVSAFAVILPSFLLLTILSHLYFHFGQIPAAAHFCQGFIPAVCAIIVVAVWNMGKKTVQAKGELFFCVLAFALLTWVGGFFITFAIIAASGLLGWIFFTPPRPAPAIPHPPPLDEQAIRRAPAATLREGGAGLLAALLLATGLLGLVGKIFVTFAAMSLVLFGGGFVFIPLIQELVVNGLGWVSQQEFIDGIALGQITPGPILISATFIGYKLAGFPGAVAATVGTFTPPGLLMVACSRYLAQIKGSAAIGGALRGIRLAVIGMIGAAAVVVGRSAELNAVSALIFATATLALLRYKVDVVYIVPVAGLLGLACY